jgi:hypothetical protein
MNDLEIYMRRIIEKGGWIGIREYVGSPIDHVLVENAINDSRGTSFGFDEWRFVFPSFSYDILSHLISHISLLRTCYPILSLLDQTPVLNAVRSVKGWQHKQPFVCSEFVGWFLMRIGLIPEQPNNVYLAFHPSDFAGWNFIGAGHWNPIKNLIWTIKNK